MPRSHETSYPCNTGSITRFLGGASALQIKNWLRENGNNVRPVEIETASGEYIAAYAISDIENYLKDTTAPTSRLRLINPFDPLVRDRKRLLRIFDFDYKIEIFVPAAKRQWGYYVYPMLEGDRFIGRVEIKADRKSGLLKVMKVWKESNIKWANRQDDKLDAEIKRLARFIGAQNVQR